MKVVVLGTGMIGRTIVYELSKSDVFDEVIAVDGLRSSLDGCLNSIESSKVSGKVVAFDNKDSLVSVLEEADIAVACLPHFLSLTTIEAAIEANCNLVDLVGSNFAEKKELHELAKEAGVLIVPGCGVAPGIVNFLAARGAELLDEAEEATMICGGIPRNPMPPLWYQVVFRLESVMGLYTKNPFAVENGELIELTPFSGIEKIDFPDPIGECEAVISDGHSVVFTLKDKIKNIYEKTVRHKGHFDKMKLLYELGFLAEQPIKVEGMDISPKQFTMSLIEPLLRGQSKEDVTVLRVTVSGLKDKENMRLEWEMVDFYNKEKERTSMANVTGIPAVIMTEWIAKGKIRKVGVIPPEELIVGDSFNPFIDELKRHGIEIAFKQEKIKSVVSS